MKIKLYLKSTFTDIRKSFGRFISIILIILMGVLLFVGIKSVGPNLEKTVGNFVDKVQLSDLQIQSIAGLTEADLEAVEEVEGTEAELGYSIPQYIEEEQLNLQIHSYDESSEQNQLIITEGQLPQANDEVILDEELADQYAIGDEVTIENDQLTESTFEVVGYADSPLYVDDKTRGATTVGDGELDGFVYIPEAAFDAEAYSIMYMNFTDLASLQPLSDEYDQALEEKVDQLETVFDTRAVERKETLQEEALDQLSDEEQTVEENQAQLTDGQNQLEAAQTQLDTQREQLEAQRAQLTAQFGAAVADEQLADAAAQLEEAEAQLADQRAELEENQAQLEEARAELEDARTEIEEMDTPNYIVNDRTSNPGFTEYTSLADRIDAIANVFPVFFFFIAILITFTTMTRMVEENRKEIGTLKALGYRKLEIASKYILYAVLAAAIGTTLGVIIGVKALPRVVFNLLGEQYIFTDYTTAFFAFPITLAVIAALIATLGSSMLVLTKNLQEKATALLLPKAPKAGKRVILERITPIWNRMNFNQKVTYRNLFRYKARMILTILGIAGCTGLMMAGFGLQDSIGAIASKQFDDIVQYQSIVTLEEEDTEGTTDYTAAQEVIEQNEGVNSYAPVYMDQVTFTAEGVMDQSVSLYAFDDTTDVGDYVTLNAKNGGGSVELTNQGAAVTSRLASVYNAEVGDTLMIQDSEGDEFEIEVSGIVENYLGHNVYMTHSYYEEVADTQNPMNAYLIKSDNMTNEEEGTFSENLLETDEVLNTTFMSDQIETQADSTDNLGVIVWIFIILSGTLAFVVLYNLTNINISERERELATIKVLGFFDNEVTMYIVRENVIFTIFGILFGFGIGNVLTWFIITMASSDMIVFPLVIHWQGYVISAVMTVLFSAIVMLFTHRKLKTINMIEALKSNE